MEVVSQEQFNIMMTEYLKDTVNNPEKQKLLLEIDKSILRNPELRKEKIKIYNSALADDRLRLLVMPGFEEFGNMVDNHIKLKRKINIPDFTYQVNKTVPFFMSGDCKVTLEDSIRGKDVYILTDIYNYSQKYKMRGIENYTSPQDNFKSLKDAISATNMAAYKVRVVMPMMYDGRQHRFNKRESRGCSYALRELQNLGVQEVITVDIHSPEVANAFGQGTFSSPFPTYQMLNYFIDNFPNVDFNNIVVVAPDSGATGRAEYYRNMLGAGLGFFNKRRDYSITNGDNIIEHQYIGESLKGKTVIVIDDILSSGNSLIDCGKKAREDGAKNIFFFPSFSLFDRGNESVKKMNEAYEKNYVDAIITTNLTYLEPSAKSAEWCHSVDFSSEIADMICDTNEDKPIGTYLNGGKRPKTLELIKKAKGRTS